MKKPRQLPKLMLVQTEEALDQLQDIEQEQVTAKLFGLDEGDESDSAADDSGWEEDDDDLLFLTYVRRQCQQLRNKIPNDENYLSHTVADQMERLGESGFSHISLCLAIKEFRSGSHGVRS
ncbi:hypothetical protein ACROYT_G021841 [Oculina patagonica]